MTEQAGDSPEARSQIATKLLPALANAMQEAAAEVQRLFLSREYSVTEKGPGDPLTTADLRSNDLLRDILMPLLSDCAWISEESAQEKDRRSHRFAWIVDPIDGTREFAAGIPEYSISAGLTSNGVPILGAVALPGEGSIILGGTGIGVFEMNMQDGNLDRCKSALEHGNLATARLLVSATEFKRNVFQERCFADLTLMPTGSVARKLALVASGQADANLSLYPKNEWDICGGIALILAAGGIAVHHNAETQRWIEHRFNSPSLLSYGLLAGSKSLVNALMDRHQKDGWKIRTSYGA